MPAMWASTTAGSTARLWDAPADGRQRRRPRDFEPSQSQLRMPHGPPARDDGAHGPCTGKVMASLLLVVGYPLALGVLARLRPVFAERRVWWFTALQAATASITAGWLLLGRPVPAALNGAALAGFAIAWLITGQRARRPARNGP